MKRIIGVLALAASSMLATTANAAVLFFDSLQGTLAAFPTNTNGQIVAAPAGISGNALNFAATQGGGDLFTSILAGTGAGVYKLSVSYFCATGLNCGAFIGLNPGNQIDTTPQTNTTDNWLATDTVPRAYPAPFTLQSTSATAFTNNDFFFSVSSTGAFGLKLEDFNGIAGDAYFRNLSLSAVPEASTWAMMIGGFGLVGGAMRRRRANPALRFA